MLLRVVAQSLKQVKLLATCKRTHQLLGVVAPVCTKLNQKTDLTLTGWVTFPYHRLKGKGLYYGCMVHFVQSTPVIADTLGTVVLCL